MTASAAGVSIRLKHSLDEDGEYNAFTNLKVDILKNQTKIGSIEATVIDRQRIPDGYFLSACDGHSSELQYMGCTVYEPRYGRTKLKSLAEYDDPEFDVMCIHTFHVEDEYKKTNSDIATTALHQLLHHPFIKGNLLYGCWKVSSVVYELDPLEAMSNQERTTFVEKRNANRMVNPPEETDETRRAKEMEKQKMDSLARQDAIPFLRNGFFQDPAIARQGNERFVVASHGNWTRPLLSETQAAGIQFYVPQPKPPAPMGKDAEILKLVMKVAGESRFSEAPTSPAKIAQLRNDIGNLVHAGGSVSRSHAIHAACANNDKAVLDCLLELDPTIINSLDQENMTPLMIAAMSAAGRSTINGIPETRAIDILLAAGADKGKEDSFGMTAYGHFKSKTAGFDEMMNAMTGQSCTTNQSHASHLAVERKLLPPLGPTTSDMNGGEGEEAGFMDYSRDDRESDAMYGGGSYDDEDEGYADRKSVV